MAEERIEQCINRLEADFTKSMEQVARSLIEMESTLYEHGALLREQGRDIREMKMRLATVETGVASLVIRQNSMDEKLDHIIALLTPRKAEE